MTELQLKCVNELRLVECHLIDTQVELYQWFKKYHPISSRVDNERIQVRYNAAVIEACKIIQELLKEEEQ